MSKLWDCESKLYYFWTLILNKTYYVAWKQFVDKLWTNNLNKVCQTRARATLMQYFSCFCFKIRVYCQSNCEDKIKIWNTNLCTLTINFK